jgi:hypothetical protein
VEGDSSKKDRNGSLEPVEQRVGRIDLSPNLSNIDSGDQPDNRGQGRRIQYGHGESERGIQRKGELLEPDRKEVDQSNDHDPEEGLSPVLVSSRRKGTISRGDEHSEHHRQGSGRNPDRPFA